jgi:hypothetical protein
MDVARQLLAVTLVLAMLGAGVWTLRRGPVPLAAWRSAWRQVSGGSRLTGRTPSMERVGRLALTPQHTLHLVRIQGLEMVVATHPQGCSVVRGNPVVEAGAPPFEASGGAAA